MSFNTFGHLFRFTSFGESHGAAIGCVVDGCPPRIPLTEADIQVHLDKRRPGQSRFTTQRQEPDAVKILSGVFTDEDGVQVTTGTPIMLLIENVDQRSKDYSDIKDKYRPGHAGYVYDVKYGITDYRGGGRASARETAVRVAAGASRARSFRACRCAPRWCRWARTRSTARAGTGTRSTTTRSSAPIPCRRNSTSNISTASASPAPRSAR